MSRFTEIRPLTAELFRVDKRTDGRTDRHDEANIRFGNVANELNNDHWRYLSSTRPTA
jgi:hypothetical protein